MEPGYADCIYTLPTTLPKEVRMIRAYPLYPYTLSRNVA